MTESESKSHFIDTIVSDDVAAGKNDGKVVTRFPPEPNGYLHIGHAKSICLNFSVAAQHKGLCNLRFDDTNPTREETEFVESIQNDVRWLGFDWDDRLYFTSGYFERLHGWALDLIRHGKAYVCDLSGDEIREYRGTLTEPGKNSPYRDRSVEESLDLFERMTAGEFAEGERVLRAKIDMASNNITLRDPVIYRILKTPHHRTGSTWNVYPMYDFAHGLSDAVEGITHSLCTLEFENHRPLYDWFLDHLEVPARPQQIEFARLNLSHTVLSKRKLRQLVEENYVSGWDDPRMPTLSGMRRRGYPAAALRNFCERIGVARFNSIVDLALLENCLREELNRTAPRVLAVMDPVRVVITNYPEGQVENFEAINNPEDPSAGTRELPFSREIFIEREDFREDPPRKFFRLAPGREVRLRYAYYITCEEVVRDDAGEVVELRCSYDPESRGGSTPDGRKVKGTIHWVSAEHAIAAEARLYGPLFNKRNPSEVEDGEDYLANLNPESLTKTTCYVEPSLATAAPGTSIQFERTGYFCVDLDSSDSKLVFNRTVPLRDSWSKIEKKQGK